MEIRYGTDIVRVERIQRLLNTRLTARGRLFTEKEQAYAEARGENRYESYAAFFAAKEAVIKALHGDVFSTWHDIEVQHDECGVPSLCLSGEIKEYCFDLGLKASTLSLSHEREYAIAGVILWGDEHI